MKLRTKRALAMLTALLVLVGAGLVYAAWTTNGNGAAYSKAGTAQPISTVDVSASTSATLYPGASPDALIKFSNPNSFPVKVTAVALDTSGSISADAGHSGCAGTNVSYTNQSGLSLVVPAASGGVNGVLQTTLTGSVSMLSSAPDACQGAVFTIPVTITAASN